MKVKYHLLVCLLITSIPLLGKGQLNNANEILEAASAACKKIKTISYQSTFAQGSISVVANIVQEYSNVPDVGFGSSKVVANGEAFILDKRQPFAFSYDGEVFKFHEEGKGDIKTIQNPDSKAVGSTLGLYYFMLVNKFFTINNGMDDLISSMEKAELVGSSQVNGKDTYQIKIFVSYKHPVSGDKVTSDSDWYIDKTSLLPVKFVSSGVSRTTIINSVQEKSKNLFDINANNEANELLVTGKEPKTDGLPKVGTSFPEFTLNNSQGKLRSMNDYKAKVFLIDFWGTWCGPCLLAMPDIQALHDKYGKQGLQVIGISVHDAPGKAEKYVASKNYTYEFLVQGDEFAKSLKLDTYPTILVLDRNGKILHAEKGKRDGAKNDIGAIIEAELKK